MDLVIGLVCVVILIWIMWQLSLQETKCPKCGGRVHFDRYSGSYTCENCGYTWLI